MTADIQALVDLNEEIAKAEDRGDRAWFESILAPQLAFQRANEDKTVDDRVEFLQKVKAKEPSDPAREPEIEAIEVIGDRAIVKCVVTQGTRRFHNLRLFVRHPDEPPKNDGQPDYRGWKLLGWANEPL